MNRLKTRLVAVVVVVAAGGLAAGCGQGCKLKNAIGSLSPENE